MNLSSLRITSVGNLPVLTSLRFFAALLVFFEHASYVGDGFRTGCAGVTFFFMLSGFILTYVYYADFIGGKPRALGRFYVARLARIYPLHIVCVGLALTMLWFSGSHAPYGGPHWVGESSAIRGTEVAAQVALVQSWFSDARINRGVNGPSWSVSCEVFFYVCFPGLLLLLTSTFRRYKEKTILAMVAVGTVLPMLLLWHLHLDIWLVYMFPPTCLVDFLLGVGLGLAFLRRDIQWPKLLRSSTVELLALCFPLVVMVVAIAAPDAVRYMAVWLPAGAAVIYVFAHGRGPISRLLSMPVFVRLGEISFAFYLTHAIVLDTVFLVFPGVSRNERGVISLAVTLALSFALFHLVEQPMRFRVKSGFQALALRRAAVRQVTD